MENFDVLACFRDLWKTKSEKRNAIHQSIISTDGCTEYCIKLKINAGDKTLQTPKIRPLEMHTGKNSSSLLTLKC